MRALAENRSRNHGRDLERAIEERKAALNYRQDFSHGS
jgi:hypothetical protein